MKHSRIKRLYSKKLAQRLKRLGDDAKGKDAEREASETIARMRAKGYRLVTRLDNGEGVFVRDDDMVGLHVQLPSTLYKQLEAECRSRDTTKRNLVMAALQEYLRSK